ncbi:MAG: protein phosphatase 2C domain-containing protein [Planktothrix sp.]
MQNPVAKHYLWTVGEGIEDKPSGTLIADRYLLKTNRIVVDTRPELPPEIPSEISDQISPYLKLFAYRLHIPQVYGIISPAKAETNKPIILLEKGPIAEHGETLMPTLTALWPDATAMRQLNWLWQIAQLWQPFSRQDVASSLLNSHLLRLQGRFVRLLQLDLDIHNPTLKQLGYFWQQWVPTAQPQIQKFLRQLTHQMTSGELRTSTQLIQQLDQALSICGRSYHRRIEIATGTDAGPTRSHNEDACYPLGSKPIQVPPGEAALAIVCDGIGGQDGGEVASSMAIDVLRQQVEQMPLHQAHWDPLSLTPKLKRATCIANDVICQRNDDENRQGRERMGTTLVMALAHIHEIYLTHLGDSRVYWISSSGCHQVTVDDDVASRQVRLGCALYRDALQQGASGALIQALGITSSVTLHPTVQRFPLDEDCVFLLCSDGLSDRDRVEQHWQTEILPVLRQEVDLGTVRDRLIEIANTQNGHDNVTLALLLITVVPKDDPDGLKEVCIAPVIPLTDDSGDDSSDTSDAEDSLIETKIAGNQYDEPSGSKIWFLSLGIAVLLGILGALLYGLGVLFNRNDPQAQPTEAPTPADTSLITPAPQPTASPTSLLTLQSLIQLGNPASNSSPITLLSEFGKTTIKGTVPEGTVFQVQRKESTPKAGNWIELKICSTPTPKEGTNGQLEVDPTATPIPLSLEAGNLGWLQEQDVNNRLIPGFSPLGQEKGKCSS